MKARKVKVLQINQYCGFGSTGKIVLDIADLVIANGDECRIAYGRYEAPKGYETYKMGGRFNNYEHMLETRLLDNHGFASRYATHKLVKYIKNYNPDVIHLHCLHGYYLNIKILFDYLVVSGKKIVWTFHDCWAFSDHAAYIDYDENGNLPKQYAKEDLTEYPTAKFSPFHNYKRKKEIFSHVPNLTIVTPSKWLKEMTEQSFFSQYPVEVIHNGIDLTKFYPDKNDNLLVNYGISLKKKIILGVASVWDKRKGFIYMNQLAESLPIDDYQVVVIGKLAGDYEISDKLVHIAQTEDVNEMRQWYSNAAVFVNPTLFDNFPTTNLESLACGTPVVTFDTGGSPEALTEKVGLVVQQQDVKSIVNELENLVSLCLNDILTQGVGFEKGAKFAQYIKLYEGLSRENSTYSAKF